MISERALIERLVLDEGEILHAYLDSEKFITIGCGRLIDPSKGGGISRDESRYLLANDIRKWIAIAGQWPWFAALDEPRQGVIVCMLHQLGAWGVANFRKMLAAMEGKDYAEAARQMLDSAWHKQTKERCERMARIMKTGIWE